MCNISKITAGAFQAEEIWLYESQDAYLKLETRRLHRRSLRLPTRRKWAQSGYLCTTPSTAQAGADAGISWS